MASGAEGEKAGPTDERLSRELHHRSGAWSMGRRIVLDQRDSPFTAAWAQGDLRPDPAHVVKRRRCRFESRTRENQRPTGPGRSRLRGAVIAGARQDRVKSLVYIAALAPDQGETVAKVFYRDEPHPNAPKLTPDAHGFVWMPEGGFQEAVAHKASADQTSIMQAVQRPLAIQWIQEPAPTPCRSPNRCAGIKRISLYLT